MKTSYRVGLLTYPGCMTAGLLTFADLLHAANEVLGARQFEMVYLGIAGTSAMSPLGGPTAILNDTNVDLVVVPGFWAKSPADIDTTLEQHADMIDAIAASSPELAFCGYCAGVCILAQAGRLNNEPATTTWWIADRMKTRFSQVLWQADQNFVPGLKTATASGVMGYLPLALNLIARKAGADIARDVSRFMVLPRPMQIHPAFRSVCLVNQATRFLQRLHRIATLTSAMNLTAAHIAAQINMSARTVQRHVKTDAGVSLAKYLRTIKLSQVADRLAETGKTAAEVCEELGFSSESNMRRMFKEETGLTLSRYRRDYGSLLKQDP